MRVLFIGLWTAVLWLSTATSLRAQPAPVDFNRDIRPILSDACYHCHGPDQARRKADLRFDREDAAKKVIVAGSLAKSKLIQRIVSNDPQHRMPPANSGRKLTNEQIELLQRWIEQGAQWQKHWAFIPPSRPQAPIVKDEAWVINPIDRFILARLEKEGLAPSSRAALTTLIRRVSLDLTGLPPTPEEVDEFLRESAVNPQAAYEKVVDRLLASPRYGERMAWRWLEAARYADTHGYQTDGPRDMYRWRDWVIEAYNRNLPFDQFTIEQLAGDMLPNATLEQKIATGFNRNHRGNSEGGIVPEEYAVEYVVDRVDTTSTVWLGLTMGCARCHDHKYDPFSQREFYQLYAYFNSIPEKGRAVKIGNSPPLIKAPTKEQSARLQDFDERVVKAEEKLRSLEPRIEEALINWRRNMLIAPYWHPKRDLHATPVLNPSIENAALRDQENSVEFDGKGFLNAGDVAKFGFHEKLSFSFWIKPKKLSGAILSRMIEEPRANGYSIQLVDGKIQVHFTQRWLDDALRVESTKSIEGNRWQHVVVTYDGAAMAAGVRIYVDGTLSENKVLLDELNQSFKTDEPLRIGSGGGPNSRFVGGIRDILVYSRELVADEIAALSVAGSVPGTIGIPVEKLTPNQQLLLRLSFLDRDAPDELREAHEKLGLLREERRRFYESLPTVMVMQEQPQPRDAFILLRGEYDKRGEKIARAVPSHLPPMARHLPNNRLGLAKWLTDSKNPLTARVAVNRMWQLHFGTGLVKTVEDFGTQGEYPSHPELLDWLATEFVRIGWDMKKMHKLIVTSATYQQSSQFRISDFGFRIENLRGAAAIAGVLPLFNPKSEIRNPKWEDPENRLLARGPRYRMSAEMVRDQALAASGLLVEKLGGPSVRPYQPAGLWKELSGADDYTQDHGENLYRRSLYTFWKRTSAPPSLMTFDASGRETCWVRETRTNTPLQALTLLNDVTYVEAARRLAERIMKEKKSADDRIERAFMLVVSRAPTNAERLILRHALDQHLVDYRKNPEGAKKLLRIGEKPADAKIDAAELAAYAQVCSLILNLDEAVTKE